MRTFRSIINPNSWYFWWSFGTIHIECHQGKEDDLYSVQMLPYTTNLEHTVEIPNGPAMVYQDVLKEYFQNKNQQSFKVKK